MRLTFMLVCDRRHFTPLMKDNSSFKERTGYWEITADHDSE